MDGTETHVGGKTKNTSMVSVGTPKEINHLEDSEARGN